jgi:NADPH2:quinone reductase
LAGVKGVGLIVEVGSEVTDLLEGQRVGWLSGGQGSFADYVVVEAAKAVPIPDEVDTQLAAAVLMQGVTAHYLATETYPIRPGDPVLVHAAAGGVGQLLVQVAKLRGGMVIGTVSTEAKAGAARAAGADHVISYDNFADEVRDLTDGHGVAVVYDWIGAATFEGSLAGLRIRGTLAVYVGPPVVPLRRWRSLGSTRADRCTSPDPRSCTTARPPKSSAAAQTTSSAGWPRGISRSTSAAATRSHKSSEAFSALEARRTTGKLLLVR